MANIYKKYYKMTPPYHEAIPGDIIWADGHVGRVSDSTGNASNSDFRVTYRFPVIFPGKNSPQWFSVCECRHPTDTERKHYFKECIRGRRIKS